MNTLSKQEKIAVGVAVGAAIVLFFGGQIWDFVGGGSAVQATNTTAGQSAADQSAQGSTTVMTNISTVKGLEVYDELVGTGATAKAGQTITADYIGYLTDGTKFDSSVDSGKPISFPLGTGAVIPGWDMGLVGMKVGGIRRLVISPDLAYGAQGKGPVPPNATLIFEVQLDAVK